MTDRMARALWGALVAVTIGFIALCVVQVMRAHDVGRLQDFVAECRERHGDVFWLDGQRICVDAQGRILGTYGKTEVRR